MIIFYHKLCKCGENYIVPSVAYFDTRFGFTTEANDYGPKLPKFAY